jgi:hypothetical protein
MTALLNRFELAGLKVTSHLLIGSFLPKTQNPIHSYAVKTEG